LGFSALAPMALGLMILIRPGISFGDAKVRWLISTCIACLPGSFLAYAKTGGGLNSFFPSLIPLTVLSIIGIAAAWETMRPTMSAPRTHMLAWLIALVTLVCAVEPSSLGSKWLRELFFEGLGDRHYPQVVQYVRNLKGRVISPDDPTIPIIALGQTCRSSWAEIDTLESPYVPFHLQEEIMKADYVLIVPFDREDVTPEMLRTWNFVPDGWGGASMGPYTLWRKKESQ
jgi:hypothetical protein